jgi:hypothetical protein
MAFLTIRVAPDLGTAARRRATAAGPAAVSTRAGYLDMLERCGFRDVREVDVTREFERTAASWIEWRDRYQRDLRDAEGDERFEERRAESVAQLEAIRAGLLTRSLFVARR